MDDDSRSIDHWRKFFDNTGLDIFELIENAVYVARMDYPKEFISKQQTKNFVDPSQDHVNPSMLDEEKTKQPKKEINQASLERAKRKLKEGYQQAEIDQYNVLGTKAAVSASAFESKPSKQKENRMKLKRNIDKMRTLLEMVQGHERYYSLPSDTSLIDMDLHMTALALELCCTWMTNKQSSESVGLIVRQKALPQALMLIRSSLLLGVKEKTSLTKLTVHRHGGVNVVGFVKWLQQGSVVSESSLLIVLC
ncbi:hypothetical protein HPP92_011830 [Vanilla planifolia]|uniref:Uncharacterized protein n=1 Tax=Vanilla planifolia TaxID=51239 RepID=A0A835V5E2_VANPL|nr:hypothetical protein HPP92_012173 [Vanilla planifolia]KAG0483746.1 hypothetical protein HPP92_011830 [Vanilla planifolia]